MIPNAVSIVCKTRFFESLKQQYGTTEWLISPGRLSRGPNSGAPPRGRIPRDISGADLIRTSPCFYLWALFGPEPIKASIISFDIGQRICDGLSSTFMPGGGSNSFLSVKTFFTDRVAYEGAVRRPGSVRKTAMGIPGPSGSLNKPQRRIDAPLFKRSALQYTVSSFVSRTGSVENHCAFFVGASRPNGVHDREESRRLKSLQLRPRIVTLPRSSDAFRGGIVFGKASKP